MPDVKRPSCQRDDDCRGARDSLSRRRLVISKLRNARVPCVIKGVGLHTTE